MNSTARILLQLGLSAFIFAAGTAGAVEIINKPLMPVGITIFDTARGPVFATPEGMTIYKHLPKGKAAKQVEVIGECIFQCASEWPPLKVAAGAKPVGDFTIIDGEGGIKQWAYKGVALQTFKYDRVPGDTLGDDTYDFNGPRVPVGEAAWIESGPPYEEPPPAPAPAAALPPGVTVQLGIGGNRYFADASGFTLYAYEGKDRCIGTCLVDWKSFPAGALSRAMGDWTVLTYDDGTRLWSYKGKPIYTYIKDAHTGEAALDAKDTRWKALVEYEAPLPTEVAIGQTESGPVYIEKATGKTLYYQGFNHRPYIYLGFDKSIFSNCYNECAKNYPPLLAPANAKPMGEWWLFTRVDGKKQWAYRGLPMYTYAEDVPGRRFAAANGRIWTDAIANAPNTLKIR